MLYRYPGRSLSGLLKKRNNRTRRCGPDKPALHTTEDQSWHVLQIVAERLDATHGITCQHHAIGLRNAVATASFDLWDFRHLDAAHDCRLVSQVGLRLERVHFADHGNPLCDQAIK